MRARLLSVVGVLVLTACGPPPEPRDPRDDRPETVRPTDDHVERIAKDFAALEDAFLDWYYESYPVRATALGIHGHDGRLPAYDRPSIQRRIDDLLDWLTELDRVPVILLDDPDRYDYGVLEFALQAELLDLEEVRAWANDPRLYTRVIADGVASLASRAYAPAPQRATDLVSRMQEARTLLEAARANLRSPPRIWTELAIADTRGLVTFLREALPAALARGTAGGRAGGRVERAAADLIAELESHAAWLETDLLPRSTGDFRLGRYLFQRKLLYEEHVNIDAEELAQLNRQKIAQFQDSVARIAAAIDPTRPPRAILDSISSLHPAPDALIPAAEGLMLETLGWVREAGIVSIPTDEVPEVVEAPSYARGELAWLDAPGPFAPGDQQAYFYITPVDSTWTAAQAEEFLSVFDDGSLLGVTVHQTFPGRFVQQAATRELDSRIRRTFVPRSLAEGWAHYAERVVVEQGFHADDPAVRLGELRRALLGQARWFAVLQLHAFGASVDDVVRRYMDIAYLDEFPARREVLRATYDPSYMVAALGRLQILELREDYRAHMEKEREEFSLRTFHDAILELGLPLTLARPALLEPPVGPRLPITTTRYIR